MALRFLNSGYFAGSVGIGTESPLKKLSVNGGDIAVNNGNSFIVGAAITGNTQIGELGADSGKLQLLTESDRDIKFGSTTYGNIMFLEGTNGNVGIGTVSPTSKLDIQQTTAGNIISAEFDNLDYTVGNRNAIKVRQQVTAGGSYSAFLGVDKETNNIFLSNDSITASHLVINSAGNVGIGTTGPNAPLSVHTTQSTLGERIASFFHTDGTNNPNLEINSISTGMQIKTSFSTGIAGQLDLYTGGGSSFITLSTAGSERMRISSAGAIKFNNYDSTNQTGTPTYLLGTDASGNVVKVLGADIPGVPAGSGTLNTVAMWTPDGDTLGDGPITFSGNNSTFSGTITSGNQTIIGGGGGNGQIDISRTSGAAIRLQSQSALGRIGTSSNHSFLLFANDATALTLDTSQNATFAGDVTLANGNALRWTSDDVRIEATTASDNMKFYVGATEILKLEQAGLAATFAGTINSGSITSTGTVSADTYFESTDASLVLGTTGAGNIFLRPNGIGSGTGAMGISSSGKISTGGIIDMNSNKITELSPGTTNLDAVNYQQLQDAIAGVLVYQGTWNASTNTPTLASGVGTPGYYYIVSVAGSTNLDGITDWLPGDWAIFSDLATDAWQKIDHTNVLNGAGTGQKVTKWDGSGTSYALTDGPITFSTNDSTFAGGVTTGTSLTVGTTALVNDTLYLAEYIQHIGDTSNNIRFQASRMTLQSKASGSAKVDLHDNGNLYLNSGGGTTLTLNTSQDATFTGNVTITGNALVGSGTIDNPQGWGKILQVQNSGSNGASLSVKDSNNEWNLATYNSYFYISDNVEERLTIDANGNVGIGTTGPVGKLTVQGDGADIFLRSNDYTIARLISRGSTGLNLDTGLFSLFVENTENVRIDANGTSWFNGGNVGIGVTGPVTKLEVAPSTSNSSIKTGTLELQSYSVNNAWLADNLYFNGSVWKLRSAGYASQVYFGSGGDITFKRYPTGSAGGTVVGVNTMQLQSNGNVGIGAAAGAAASKLQVAGGIQMADDAATAVAAKVGTLRYRTSGNNSYVDMCMQTAASTYAWINIVQNNW